jgi:hypothetical protein
VTAKRPAQTLVTLNCVHVSTSQKLEISAAGPLGICALLIVLALLTLRAGRVPQQ